MPASKRRKVDEEASSDDDDWDDNMADMLDAQFWESKNSSNTFPLPENGQNFCSKHALNNIKMFIQIQRN